jgi:RNA polymerase sigma factor (sigma-70 family)
MSYFDFNRTWEQYYPLVYGYFFRRVNQRQDVEDLTSMVLEDFLQVLSNPDKVKRVQNIHGYLWKIAHNYLYHFIDRKTKRPLPISLDDNLEACDQMVEDQRSDYYEQRLEHVLNCVKKELSGQEYDIVELAIIKEVKSPEIGARLQLKADNVRKKLSRALDKLREKCRAVWEQ